MLSRRKGWQHAHSLPWSCSVLRTCSHTEQCSSRCCRHRRARYLHHRSSRLSRRRRRRQYLRVVRRFLRNLSWGQTAISFCSPVDVPSRREIFAAATTCVEIRAIAAPTTRYDRGNTTTRNCLKPLRTLSLGREDWRIDLLVRSIRYNSHTRRSQCMVFIS